MFVVLMWVADTNPLITALAKVDKASCRPFDDMAMAKVFELI